MKCPDCDSIIANNIRGKITCKECDTPLFVEKHKKRLTVISLEIIKALHYHPKLNVDGKKYKPVVRKSLLPMLEGEALNPIPHWDCIKCNVENTDLVGSIRGRILKGYRVKMGHKLLIVDYPPVDTKPYPAYKNGRLCVECSRGYALTNKAPQWGEVQPLKELIPIAPHSICVTLQTVETEDADIEKQVEQANQDKAGYMQVGRIKIPLGTGKHVRFDEEPVEIDSKAYRKYGASSRGGIKNYDKEVNFDNVKGGKVNGKR